MSPELILCEGKWDLVLLQKYIDRYRKSYNTDYFLMENVDVDQRGKETRKIRNLNEPYYPYNLFVKSENGRSFHKRTYAATVMTLAEGSFGFHLMIDCDNKGVEGWLSDVNEKCDGKYTKTVKSIKKETKYRSAEISSHIAEVRINGISIDEFGIIGFRSSMEEAVGIDKGAHDASDKEELIERFVDDTDFQKAVERVIF